MSKNQFQFWKKSNVTKWFCILGGGGASFPTSNKIIVNWIIKGEVFNLRATTVNQMKLQVIQ